MTDQIPIEPYHPTMRVLSDEQIGALHHTSLDILSRTGIVMRNEDHSPPVGSTCGRVAVRGVR